MAPTAQRQIALAPMTFCFEISPERTSDANRLARCAVFLKAFLTVSMTRWNPPLGVRANVPEPVGMGPDVAASDSSAMKKLSLRLAFVAEGESMSTSSDENSSSISGSISSGSKLFSGAFNFCSKASSSRLCRVDASELALATVGLSVERDKTEAPGCFARRSMRSFSDEIRFRLSKSIRAAGCCRFCTSGNADSETLAL